MTSAAAAGTTAGIPCDGIPQIAMAGRSNVGKSSLINALSRAKIARTSAAPGKTRLANIYRLTLDGGPGKWGLYLVDLPGYGYARGGADAAAELRAVAEGYFAGRESRFAVRLSRLGVGGARNARRGLEAADGRANSEPQTANRGVRAALLLVDSRHPGLESDLQAARWLQSMNIEHRVVATKVDKLSRTERARSRQALENSFGMPPLAVSATSGEGLDTLWKTIASLVRAGHE